MNKHNKIKRPTDIGNKLMFPKGRALREWEQKNPPKQK